MVTRMKSSQVQQEFGEVMDRALSGTEVVVERYGSPKVVIVDYRRYQQLLDTERQMLRSRLQRASEEASARAEHLSEAEVDELIERARSEVHEKRSSS